MANPIILHCFDEGYNIIEETVAKLFRNPKGVVDISTSRDKMYDVLSIMELDDHFMVRHLDRLDIPKLIVRKTLTNPVFEERIETIFKFIIEGTTGTLEERFNLITVYMRQNMGSDEIDKNVMKFMYIMKYHIEKIVEADEELDDFSANYLELLYRVNNLFLTCYSEVFANTKEDVFTTLFGVSLLIYMVKNPNAPAIEDEEYSSITDVDIAHAINIDPELLMFKQYRRKFIKLVDALDMELEEA